MPIETVRAVPVPLVRQLPVVASDLMDKEPVVYCSAKEKVAEVLVVAMASILRTRQWQVALMVAVPLLVYIKLPLVHQVQKVAVER
ncbi:hypothetical protein D3C71_1837090 [compost metagenome]